MSVYTYTVLPFFDRNPDILVHTGHGWVNISKTDGWDWFYYIYIALYATMAVVLLLRWGRYSIPNDEKRQAEIISFPFFFAVVLGYITGVLPVFFHIRFLQAAAVFALVMIFAAGYCINRYHFLQPVAIDQNEMILSKSVCMNAYLYLGLMLFAGARLLLTDRPFYTGHQDVVPVQVVSGPLVLLGTFLASIERLRLENNTKEMLVSLSLTLMISLYTLRFADEGIFIVWSSALLPMIICLFFNRLIILSAVTVTAFLTQPFAWGYTPSEVIVLPGKYYLDQVGVITFAAIFAMYVNKVYMTRFQENIDHVIMQSIASDISHSFVSSGEMNIDQKLYVAPEECGRFIECDRVCLVLMNMQTNTVRYTVEWMSEAVSLPRGTLSGTIQNIRSEMFRRFQGDEALVPRDTLSLPTEAAEMRAQSLAQGIRALVAVPVRNKGEFMGFIGFHTGRPFSIWNLDSIAFIEVVGLVLSDTVIKTNGEKEPSYSAFHGRLTDLPNCILFKERLSEWIPHVKRNRKVIGVIFLDPDMLKPVSDMLGHSQGDRPLIKIVKALSSSIRDGDTIAHFGRDESTLMPSQIASQKELTAIVDRLMRIVQKPILSAEQELLISVSASVAVYPQDGDDPEVLLKDAGTVVHHAKSEGKGCYVFYPQEIRDEIQVKTQLVNQLYHVLEKNQLLLCYQPQIDMAMCRVVGMEALACWNLPGQGVVSPTEFTPLAGRIGLIYAVGKWVMCEACRQDQFWLGVGCMNLRTAVNVSVRQLRSPKSIPPVKETPQMMKFPPNCLELETTESAANGNTDHIITILRWLKVLDTSIPVNDFGVEYSFLSRLKLLPVDRIKMDIQLVHGTEKNNRDRAILKVIINFAKNLKMKVTAERVEAEPQLNFLSQRICDEVQGFYCYRLMPTDKAEALLRETLCTQKENTYNTGL